jgi:hypothetical protein
MLNEPPVPGTSGDFLFMVGIFIHPLLIIPPATILQKYLHRIPVLYAVFFGAFISICVLVGPGATQGDQIFVQLNGVQFIREEVITVIAELIIASGIFGLIIMLDIILTGTEEENS